MRDLHSLLDVRAVSLIGRDPASLIMDVLDETMQDDLRPEMDALAALAASHSLHLPHGRTRTMAVEMAPMLCSLVRNEAEIRHLLSFVHDWIEGLGDVARTARRVHALMVQAALVVAEHGAIDLERLATLPPLDQEAMLAYQEAEESTATNRSRGTCTITLRVHDHATLTAVVGVGRRRAVVGATVVDDDDGNRTRDRTPELVA